LKRLVALDRVLAALTMRHTPPRQGRRVMGCRCRRRSVVEDGAQLTLEVGLRHTGLRRSLAVAGRGHLAAAEHHIALLFVRPRVVEEDASAGHPREHPGMHTA